jgi:hypothetical protein
VHQGERRVTIRYYPRVPMIDLGNSYCTRCRKSESLEATLLSSIWKYPDIYSPRTTLQTSMPEPIHIHTSTRNEAFHERLSCGLSLRFAILQ